MTDSLPHDTNSEECVLGAILIDPEAIDKINILPQDFYSLRNRIIFETFVSLQIDGMKIDQVNVSQELAKQGLLDKVGGVQYLTWLIGNCPTSFDIESYAVNVKKAKFYRNLKESLLKGCQIADTMPNDVGKAMSEVQQLVSNQPSANDIPRDLKIQNPRMIMTDPIGYIWDVNGRDLRLASGDVTSPQRFKNIIITKMGFVPIMPKNWDDTLNHLLTTSVKIDAPLDASDEYQIKLAIQQWIEQTTETKYFEDLSRGLHIVKELNGITYVCFQVTPLLEYLKRKFNRVFKPGFIWWNYVCKWGGIKHEWRVLRAKDGVKTPVKDLWCLPKDFIQKVDKSQTQQELPVQQQTPSLEDFG